MANIATNRLGLVGSSAAYVCGYLGDNEFPMGVPADLIAKVAGKIEKMARELLPVPRLRSRREK